MTRGISPQNRALQDRIMAVLADAHPALLTSSEIAERVGGAKTIWEVCRKGKTYTVERHGHECAAQPSGA